MTNILKIAAITALLGASASASAWWGGPGSSSFMDEFFGDGNADFNMSMNTSTHGWGRGHSYNAYAPYYGYGYGAPYGYAPYAVAPVAPIAPVALQTPVAPTTQNLR